MSDLAQNQAFASVVEANGDFIDHWQRFSKFEFRTDTEFLRKFDDLPPQKQGKLTDLYDNLVAPECCKYTSNHEVKKSLMAKR